MKKLKILQHAIILLFSQIALGFVVEITLFTSEEFIFGSTGRYITGYAFSFVVSSIILAYFAANLSRQVTIHISMVAFIALLTGTLISYLVTQMAMPTHLYILDVAFTLVVILTSVVLGKLIRKKTFFRKPVCPACGERKGIRETRFVVDIIDKLFETESNWVDFFYDSDKKLAYKYLSGGDNWACDSCLTQQAALIAYPSKQKFCDYPPYLAYLDSAITCKSCGEDFVFTMHEKQYWYEELNFWVQSLAENCPSCRAEKRHKKSIIKNAQERLHNLLPNLDKTDEAQIKEVIDLYTATNSTKKVKEYVDILRKIIRTKEEK